MTSGMVSCLGIGIAGVIVAALLCIISLLALVNDILGWWGSYLNIDPPLSIQLVLVLFYPVVFPPKV
jgi:concentrative nucleoside transporter, CNT family